MMRLTPVILLMTASVAFGQSKGPANVYVAPVVEKTIVSGQSFIGEVRPIKANVLGAAVDGRVEAMDVEEGQFVKKGDPLAKLRTGTLEIERDAAAAELKVREAEEAEIVNGWRAEEIEAARASFAAADARRTFTKARRDRAMSLFKSGGNVSQDEVQETASAHDQAEQMYLSSKANYEMYKAGQRQEKKDQARARTLQQKEIVNRLEDQIKLHTVRAYYDGFVTVKHCDLGQWLLRGQSVVEMVKLDEVEIEVGVPQEVVSHLKPGASARIEAAGLESRAITGKISAIVPQANSRTRTFPVKVKVEHNIENGLPILQSRMIAKVTLPVGRPELSTLVPKDALVLGGPAPMVYVADPAEDGKTYTARPVMVQLGIADGSWIQVVGDLKPGMKVVVQGNERIFPKSSLTVTKELPGPK